ncbi:MAG: TonB-dependent receptor [bacterium]|nr:TonB-dependent receptor [bacterium]
MKFAHSKEDNLGLDDKTLLQNIGWRYLISERFYYNLYLARQKDSEGTEVNFPEVRFRDKYEIERFGIRNDLGYEIDKNHSVEIGAFYTIEKGTYSFKIRDIKEGRDIEGKEEYNKNPFEVSFYLQNKLNLGRIHLFPGLRWDYFKLNERRNISPRFNLSYDLLKDLSLNLSAGAYYEPPELTEFSKVNGEHLKDIPSKLVNQYVLGVDHKFRNVNIKLEGYYKDYKRLVLDKKGFAKGIDLLFKYKDRDILSFLSYSYLVSKRYNEDIKWYYHDYDETHTIPFVFNYKLKRWLDLNLKYHFGSGKPYTPYKGTPIEGKWNSERYPEYQRVDLKLSKDFRFSNSELTTYLEIVNLFNHKNVFMYYWDWDEEKGSCERKAVYQLPFLPILGAIFKF